MQTAKKHILLFFCCFISFVSANDSISFYLAQHKTQLTSGKYKDAFNSALKALSLAQKSGTEAEKAKAFLSLGTARYYNRMDKDQTIGVFHSARSIIDHNSIDSLAFKVYHNIGSIYVEQNIRDSAIFYLSKAASILEQKKMYKELSSTYAVIAEMFFTNKNELFKAEKFITLAENFAARSKDSSALFFAYIKRGLYNFYQHKFKQASEIFFKAKQIADNHQNVQEQLYVYRLYAESKACEVDTNVKMIYDRFIDKQDSVFRLETTNKLAELESTYGLERKEFDLKLKNAELINQKKQSFYNTLIFITLIIILVLIAIMIIVKQRTKRKLDSELARINQQQAVLETKEKERNRISAELHDNVGSSVSFISSKIDWLMKNRSFNESEKKELLFLKDSSQEVMNSLRETLWTLNNKNISNTDLSDKLKVYLKKHILCSLKIIDVLKSEHIIPNEDVLAIFRCSQEIVNNINKHSNARSVKVEFHSDNNTKLQITIHDDGVGFEEVSKDESYGLRNIKNRLKEIGAQLQVNSSSGKGTTISITYF